MKADVAIEAARYFSAEEDGHERAHILRMMRRYKRMEQIAEERYRLEQELKHLRDEIVGAIGVEVGEVVTLRGGRRGKVVSASGNFEFCNPHGTEVRAAVRCYCALETKDGWHKTRTELHTVWDDDSFSGEEAMSL